MDQGVAILDPQYLINFCFGKKHFFNVILRRAVVAKKHFRVSIVANFIIIDVNLIAVEIRHQFFENRKGTVKTVKKTN